MDSTNHTNGLTRNILIAMLLGISLGIILNKIPRISHIDVYLVDGLLDIGGKIFIAALKMLVVPIVFVSLVCGTCKLNDTQRFGRLALKTLVLYLLTTALAISLALIVASIFKIGAGSQVTHIHSYMTPTPPPLKQTIIDIFPSNVILAMSQANMLQVIVFAILLGLAIAWSGEPGVRIAKFFIDLDVVVMRLISMIIKVTPIGVFCLISFLFAKTGFALIGKLAAYFATVLLVLMIQLFLSYGLLLKFVARLNPVIFYKKMLSAMMFAFSTSSSNASIPFVLDTVENKLGVRNIIASFIIPLGATINMDGTAIMQGVATVFIANVYNIDIGLTGYLTVVLTATMASIGTAGVPGVGIITLAMVLQQVGLPVEGIALIIGVDRLLDMTRTAVNICGDAMVSCIVAKSEKALQLNVYES